MFQENVQVLWNKKVGPSFYTLGLTCNRGYADAVPGQFIMLRIPDQKEPLLRRPFSIHRLIYDGGHLKGIEILYKVVGECTKRYSELMEGHRVDLMGPLGNGFSVLTNVHHIYIAAGGIGVAPLIFLVQFLKKKGLDLSACDVFLGGRSKEEVLCKDEFMRHGTKIYITTDDGSEGEKGLVTDPLEAGMIQNPPDIIYACGPPAMLKSVARIAESNKVPCQVSIETVMACGMGACLGCAVEGKKDSGKYRHACIDGPVFDAADLKI